MKKKKAKLYVDICMAIMLPVLMAYKLIGEAIHEWCGIGMFLLLFMHHILNCGWHRTLIKGKYTKGRMISAFVNILLLIDMLLLMWSGMVLSQHVFTFLPFRGMQSSARIVHLTASYWGFVCMAVHMGFHGRFLSKQFCRKLSDTGFLSKHKILIGCSVAIVSLYGIYAFNKRQILEYMLLRMQYVFFDFEESVIFFIADYTVIMLLFVFAGYYITRLCTRKISHK